MHRFIRKAAGAAKVAIAMAFAAQAHAVTVLSVSPQGEVSQVRQITVKFSEPVVPFGDLRQADPYALSCEGPVPNGAGRWVNERTWVYDFQERLLPGTVCSLKARSSWAPIHGTLAVVTKPYTFSTNGPAVSNVEPNGTIEEEQNFLLSLTGPAVEATVLAHAHCEVDGIGERMPLRIVTGAAREEVIKQRHPGAADDRLLLVTCQRPLPSGTAVRLIWGAGIASKANPKVLTREVQRFDFRTRRAFKAEFSCERERADAPCLPIRPMRLGFSAPVARKLAEGVKLKPAQGAVMSPVFDVDDKSEEVDAVTFPTPLAESMAMTVELPRDLKDLSGRHPANASSFPLKVATGEAPPIAKFAAAPFGVIELNADAMLPLTLRHVQGDLRPAAPSGSVRVKTLQSDEDILAWYAKVARYHESQMSEQDAGLPEAQWSIKSTDSRGRVVHSPAWVHTRTLSLLDKAPDVRRLDLPQLQGGDPRPFEVVGLPLSQPGYHVVEVESRRLGDALLDPQAPMYVRTGVLVTNLGVHFKLGRENSLAWVTTLDKGQPVADAEVHVNSCQGKRLWTGRTDANGVARINQVLPELPGQCAAGADGYFVTARKTASTGVADTAFVFSSWQKGVESWRFNQPISTGREPDRVAHTVFDRSLFRAGETVSMKHFMRAETSAGLAALPPHELPRRLKIVHQGSGEEFVQPLSWNASRSASSSWVIPASAKLGVYEVSLEGVDDKPGHNQRQSRWSTGDFRVEEFRIPLVDAKLSGPKVVPINPRELPMHAQLNYFSGGGVAQAPARVSAMLRVRGAYFPGYDEFNFGPPGDGSEESDGASDEAAGVLVADKLPLTTDREGAATVTLKDLPPIQRPSELVTELDFNDPNGETQTASTRIELWPSAVVLGVKAGAWASSRGQVKFQVLAIDTLGQPIQGQQVEVRGRLSQTISTRKRMVGGFYAYDNRTETKDLGALCNGSTDNRGLLLCEASLDKAGQVELIAQTKDRDGHATESATSVWVTKLGELWFSQDNDDRIDVLPEKKSYQPGETARLQVRMPFREATVLVSVEREGILSTQVQTLRGDDPTLELKIDKAWGPNVFVSVLALRGRIREVPWYSFFTWGWREPMNWLRTYWYEGREYQAPTAMVDLSKPAFKLGVAALNVGIAAHALDVSVTADKPLYTVRQKAIAKVKVTHEGKPVAGAEIAFAAVDEGLLALRGNTSWNLLDSMIRPRPWGVETSTGQSEIIGRRHYGRKAIPAGGGGGNGGSTRELFDTLLVWKDRVVLDANGEATIEVPLNDALTSFRLVAIADAGADAKVQQFGTGSASIRVTQDLQLLSGLPPLVREGDRFVAMLTLRNTTKHEMKVRAQIAGTVSQASDGNTDAGGTALPPLQLPPQELVLPAEGAKEVTWPIDVPAYATHIAWEASAEELGGDHATDKLKVSQAVTAAVPVRVLQATLQQLDGPFQLPVEAPADGLQLSASNPVKRGGLAVAVQPKLTGALPGLRRYFDTYPFICLEQKTSKSVGLKDAKLWATVSNALPTYLDRDGLASYFPPSTDSESRGSDKLTAYVLAATNEAGFELPPQAQQRMLDGLAAFVAGRIERKFWSPKPDLDVRKLAAIEAMSRYGRAEAKMLGSIRIAPNTWPTAALIDWLSILKRVKNVPDQATRLDEVQQLLRSRLTYAGTTMRFSNETDDFWWWLMDNADVNAARLILTVLDDPAWKDDLPRMVVGHLARQHRGHWLTTTANLWGSLALDKFSAKFESVPVAGRTVASTAASASSAAGGASAVAAPAAAASSASIDWSRQADGGRLMLPWPEKAGTLQVAQEGSGKPWLTVQALAAVPLKGPLQAGYRLTRSVSAVERKDPNQWTRGDVMRVRLEIEAQADMTWVVVSDPVPGGATLLGSGLGRDSTIAATPESRESSATYEERSFEAFRSYYEYMPAGQHVIEYTLRLNNPGRFLMPPTRAEAMYAPETFGEVPNDAVEVQP